MGSKRTSSTKSHDTTSNGDVKLVPIPQPSKAPFIGNLPDIDVKFPLDSMVNLAEKYGSIYKLSLPGLELVTVSNWDLVHEVCDDSRFRKSIKGDLEELRAVVHDGLFTSSGEEEENWGIAHRVLMTAFGPLFIRSMFDEMHEVARQLALKWARQGPHEPLDIGGDTTRLALDTVALCSMGFRFNSYYRQDLHPFIRAMNETLDEAGRRASRVLPSVFYHGHNRKFRQNISLLRTTAAEVLDARRSDPVPNRRKDLLGAMLDGVDPETGKKMTDESIIDNLITFLVAGHETTAGTLSFTLYNLAKFPEVCRQAQREVDQVVGKGAVKLEHIAKLKYISALIRETMRLNAPITAFAREAVGDQVVGGRYLVKDGTQIVCFLTKSHSDPVIWGPDAGEFRPERMLDDNFDRMQKKYPHCWAPFGTGIRGCIGRPFAWQEMVLALAVLLQNYNFVMHNPTYALQIAQSLTIRPKDLYLRAISREGLTPAQLESRLAGGYIDTGNAKATPVPWPADSEQPAPIAGRTMAIYYGSNSGTCEFMARRLAADAGSHGYVASVDSLNAAKEALHAGVPVVILTASYEGQPTQNACHFVNWIQNLDEGRLKGVQYAVWGCDTYQKIPAQIDSTLKRLGASRIAPIGTTNAKDRDMFSDFETWEDQTLWPALRDQFGGSASASASASASVSPIQVPRPIEVFFSTPRTANLRQDVRESLVVGARSLSRPCGGADGSAVPEKRHLEIQLPTGWSYAAGDNLAVLPHNPRESVARTMRRFNLAWDTYMTIRASTPTTLPTDVALPVSEVLSSYVEINHTATKRNIAHLHQFADHEEMRDKILHLGTAGFDDEVRSKSVSVLGILEKFPALRLPFETFLLMLPPMRVRQYSISSSPLADNGKVTLTYSVLDAPAHSGMGRHVGVASSYLATLLPGDKLQVSVRPATGGFHLPAAPEQTPMICIAAGTGLAPFRAFTQQRAAAAATLLASSSSSGGSATTPTPTPTPMLLFFGCRDPDEDDLYRDEFDAWERAGVVVVHRAYSRRAEAADGCRYVQDRLWREREAVGALWQADARVYICGAGRMATAVKEVLVRIMQTEGERLGQLVSAQERLAWFEKHRNERFATHVFD